jgi:hypothetical protein
MSDRLLDPMRELTRAELPELPALGVYAYTVLAVTPLGFDVAPVSPGAPPLQTVPGGQLGPTTMLAMIGQRVLVAFEGQDASRPIVLCVAITSTMLVDSTMATVSGPVTIVAPLVAPLVAP